MTILFIFLLPLHALRTLTMLSPIACKRSPFPIVTYPSPIQTYLPPSPTKFPANTLPFLIRTFQHRLYNGSYIFSRRVGSPLCVNQACGKLRARQKSGKFGNVRFEISKLFKFQESIREFEHGWHRMTSDKLGRSRTRSVQSSRSQPIITELIRSRIYWISSKFFFISLNSLSVAVTGIQTSSAYWNCSLVAIMLKIFFGILRNNWDKRCKKSSLCIIYSRCQISFSILSLLLSALCLIFAPDRSSSRNVAVIRET